jgi:hypothetical protein
MLDEEAAKHLQHLTPKTLKRALDEMIERAAALDVVYNRERILSWISDRAAERAVGRQSDVMQVDHDAETFARERGAHYREERESEERVEAEAPLGSAARPIDLSGEVEPPRKARRQAPRKGRRS